MARFKIHDVSQGTLRLRYDRQDVATEYALLINNQEIDSSTVNYDTVLNINCVQRPGFDSYSYTFDGWYKGNTLLTSNHSYNYTISMPMETVTAKFIRSRYLVQGMFANPDHGSNAESALVTSAGTANLSFTCYKPYELKTYIVDGSCNTSYTQQLLTNGHIAYNFTISNVRSNVVITLNTKLREEYTPFYIVPDADAVITVSEENPDNLNFVCMLANDETVEMTFNHDTSVLVDAGTPLYIWSETVRDQIFPRMSQTLLQQGLFIVNQKNNPNLPCTFTVGGNIMSLLIPRQIGSSLTMYSTSVLGSNNTAAFAHLLAYRSVTDAKDLILPTNTASSCYYRAFFNTPLVAAPQLRAIDVADAAYAEMFADCSQLRGLYTVQSNWIVGSSASASKPSLCNKDWVKNVPGGGTFYKTAVLDASYGDSWIPANWTIKEIL